MNLLAFYGIVIVVFIGFILGRLKTQFFNMSDSNEMIEQANRCYKHDFSKSSQIGTSTLPTTDGCKAIKTDDGVTFTSQSRLTHSSIL